MLQDLAFGKLDNAFAHRAAQPQDVVVCVQKGGILLKREPDDTLVDMLLAEDNCTYMRNYVFQGKDIVEINFDKIKLI